MDKFKKKELEYAMFNEVKYGGNKIKIIEKFYKKEGTQVNTE